MAKFHYSFLWLSKFHCVSIYTSACVCVCVCVCVYVSVQFSRSVVFDSATPRNAVCQASLSITNSWNLLKLMSIEPVMPCNHFILCHPLLPPSIFPSIRVFSNESFLPISWPKYWSFSFSISPFNEYSLLISFKIDWFDLADKGTLKSLLKHHSSKGINLWAFSLFYYPTLTCIHDYWKNLSLDYMDLCRQSNISAFYCTA